MDSKTNKLIGSIFIIVGILFALRLFGILSFELTIGFFFAYFWPLFIIVPGIWIHLKYFTNKKTEAAILIPGGIFLVVGLTCQLGMLFNAWELVWPGFILSVAVGFFEYYLFGSRNKTLLIPVAVLGGLTSIFTVGNVFSWIFKSVFKQILLVVVFVILGIMFLFKRK